jgi:hypothetical protein
MSTRLSHGKSWFQLAPFWFTKFRFARFGFAAEVISLSAPAFGLALQVDFFRAHQVIHHQTLRNPSASAASPRLTAVSLFWSSSRATDSTLSRSQVTAAARVGTSRKNTPSMAEALARCCVAPV